MLGFFKKNWPVLLPLIFGFLIIFRNFSPDTWLSGWDNLHTEFDFALNLKRSLSSVWQEQGVGFLDGMAHAADLPRQLVLWLFSSFLPAGALRYFWVFAMLFFGPLGTYFLVREITAKNRVLPALSASLFYLLNLATLQTFYTPFETFVSFYGFLPWLLYLAIRYIREGKERNLLALFLASLLGTTAFYVQTLFIVYAIFLGAFLFEAVLRHGRGGLNRLAVVGFIVFLANSYWLLPASYFALTSAKNVSLAHQNMIATPDTRYFNENRNTFDDIVKLKGFWFDYRDFDGGNFEEILADWRSYTDSREFNLAAYTLFSVSVLGFVFGLFSKKVATRAAGVFLFGLCYLALSKANLPLGVVLQEAFRSVFTKWSVAFSLILSIGIGYFVYFVGSVRPLGRYLVGIVSISLIGLMVFIVRPVFEGKLIYKNLKINYPSEYSELFNFFKGEPKEGRIAVLPMGSMWGWEFHDWGYRGSGFLWYGVKQPILHRSFDVWSPYNESFYAEASRALYAGENDTFEKVLEKYQVKYLLLDESVINTGGSPELLFIPEIKRLIATSSNIYETARFGPAAAGLTVYETNFGGQFVSAPEVFWRFDTDSTYSPVDTVFNSYGNYVNDAEGTTFPFVNFDKMMGVVVEEVDDRLWFTSKELQFKGAKDLVYPDLIWGEKKESPRVLVNEEKKVQVSLPTDQKISADLANPEQENRFQNCDLKKVGEVKRRSADGKVTHFAASGGVACEFFDFPNLSHAAGYTLHIKGENKAGRSLKIYLQNWATNRMDLEELLPEGVFDQYFFILPQLATSYKLPATAQGYSLNLETRSFGRIASENTIETIEFIPVPIEWLRQIRLEPTLQGPAFKGETLQGDYSIQNNLKILDVKKTGTWLYRVQVEGDGLLVLGQGYEPGWIALTNFHFPFSIYHLLPHVKVNSWANGWEIKGTGHEALGISSKTSPYSLVPNASVVYIFFWPQLLEYLGFGILGLTTVVLGLRMNKA